MCNLQSERVLPLPPNPISVISRHSGCCSFSITSRNSRLRPTSGVRSAGRLCLGRVSVLREETGCGAQGCSNTLLPPSQAIAADRQEHPRHGVVLGSSCSVIDPISSAKASTDLRCRNCSIENEIRPPVWDQSGFGWSSRGRSLSMTSRIGAAQSQVATMGAVRQVLGATLSLYQGGVQERVIVQPLGIGDETQYLAERIGREWIVCGRRRLHGSKTSVGTLLRSAPELYHTPEAMRFLGQGYTVSLSCPTCPVRGKCFRSDRVKGEV